jgi:hypothetical protein
MLDVISRDIFNTEMQIQKFELVLKKLRIKNNGENILENILVNQVQLRKKDLAVFRRRIQICHLMSEILKDYEYNLLNLIHVP